MNNLLTFFLIFIALIDVHCVFSSKKIKIKQKSYGNLTKDDVFKIKNALNTMNGREFEQFIGFILERSGYKVEITQATNDGGKDIILNNDTYIECKCYNENNTIGRPILQKLVGAMVGDNIQNGILVTTSTLTKDAVEYIKKCNCVNIQVWYLEDILDICKQINRYEFNEFSYC